MHVYITHMDTNTHQYTHASTHALYRPPFYSFFLDNQKLQVTEDKLFSEARCSATPTVIPQPHHHLITSQTGQARSYNFTSETIMTKGGKVTNLMVTTQASDHGLWHKGTTGQWYYLLLCLLRWSLFWTLDLICTTQAIPSGVLCPRIPY